MASRSPLIERAAEAILRCRCAVALTGAGISVESGIPDFRSASGLWQRFDPLEYATIEAFHRNPRKVWKMLAELHTIVSAASPNAAHRALAELEAAGRLAAVITQNVDHLHEKAGSRNVITFHGDAQRLRCLSCGGTFPAEGVKELPPPCPECGAILKPDVVLFGEAIPPEAIARAWAAVEACDLLLVVGTSAEVFPAGEIPYLARERGATIVEVNPDRTKISAIATLSIHAPAGEVLPRIVARIEALEGQGETSEGGG